MSLLGTVTDMMSNSALSKVGAERKPGGEMGKHDFLMLLSAQLRFQNPLEPQNDADFAAGLAQFSSLEQMQNMNASLEAMAGFQANSLIGKFVVAEALVDGKWAEVPGVVDSIFMKEGVAMAQIGEYVVPVSSIKEVFNTDNILTSEMLMTTSKALIGREVTAQVDGKDIDGIVTRVLVDKGSLLAQLDVGTDEPVFVPVNSIVDIREAGSFKHTPKPEVPPDAKNWKEDGDDFLEVCEAGVTTLGRWTWNEEQWKWLYTDYTNPSVDDYDEDGKKVA